MGIHDTKGQWVILIGYGKNWTEKKHGAKQRFHGWETYACLALRSKWLWKSKNLLMPSDFASSLIGMMDNELTGKIKKVIFQHSPKPICNKAIATELRQPTRVVAKITADLFNRAFIECVSRGCWRWKDDGSQSKGAR